MSVAEGKGLIYSLTKSGKKFANPDEDIRGRTVIDSQGHKMGYVEDLLMDDFEDRIRFVQIAHGGFLGIGRDHFLTPVNAITRMDEKYVHIDRTREDITRMADYAPRLVEGQDPGGKGWWEQGPDGLPGVPIQ